MAEKIPHQLRGVPGRSLGLTGIAVRLAMALPGHLHPTCQASQAVDTQPPAIALPVHLWKHPRVRRCS
jgi:hypothetical protein